MAVSEVSPLLLSALRRLVDLIDVPEEVPILAPLIQREICYPLLAGDQGKRLRLHEAKRQMLTVHLDASLASLRVGYESPSPGSVVNTVASLARRRCRISGTFIS